MAVPDEPVRALVLAGPGTNRDHDVVYALELAGADARIVLAHRTGRRPSLLDGAGLAVVAGGFSYADALGAGRMWRSIWRSGWATRCAASSPLAVP